MRLQLALDSPSLESALRLLSLTADLADIVEVGTPLILAEGMRAIAGLRRRFTGPLLADLKIMDAGELEARMAIDAGADLVTVLAAAHEETLALVADVARRAGKESMADLIGVADPVARLAVIGSAGVDLVCCHTAFDRRESGASPTEALAAVRRALPSARLAVAGGITPCRIGELRPFSPEIVVVGGFVAGANDPRAAIIALRAALA